MSDEELASIEFCNELRERLLEPEKSIRVTLHVDPYRDVIVVRDPRMLA